MKIVIDTSILVDIDRKKQPVVDLCKRWCEQREELIISTTTVAEIISGAKLYHSNSQAVATAQELLNQFRWRDVDGEIAEVASDLLAEAYQHHYLVDFADILIAATAIAERADVLCTQNKKDFVCFAALRTKVFTTTEILERR